MNVDKSKISVSLIKPIDCSTRLLDAIQELLLSHTTIREPHFYQGLLGVERFVVAVYDKKTLAATACLKFQHKEYHRYLFAKAGVPQMYNPDSLESAWVCVDPSFRALGIWNKMHNMRADYMGNRPFHATHRVNNDVVAKRSERRDDYVQAGHDFKSVTSDHMLRLLVANHAPVYNPEIRIIYGAQRASKDT